jgi:hypothetical protein
MRTVLRTCVVFASNLLCTRNTAQSNHHIFTHNSCERNHFIYHFLFRFRIKRSNGMVFKGIVRYIINRYLKNYIEL